MAAPDVPIAHDKILVHQVVLQRSTIVKINK
jgi:hypothetical protein